MSVVAASSPRSSPPCSPSSRSAAANPSFRYKLTPTPTSTSTPASTSASTTTTRSTSSPFPTRTRTPTPSRTPIRTPSPSQVAASSSSSSSSNSSFRPSSNYRNVQLILLLVLMLSFSLYFILLLTISSSPDVSNTVTREPTIAVGVLVTPHMKMYWDRFVAMSEGWYSEFSPVNGYTLDAIEGKNDSRLIHVHKLFNSEKTESGENWTNIPLAAYQHMGDNIEADWYLQVDEDTVIVPVNLKKLVAVLSELQRPVMLGKCAFYEDEEEGRISFNVGGAGILMNRALMSALRPVFDECRRRFNRVYFSDARIGACVSHRANISDAACPGKGQLIVVGGQIWSFTNRGVRVESKNQPPNALIVSMHEKSPSRIRRLNSYVKNMTEMGVEITWRSMTKVLDENGF